MDALMDELKGSGSSVGYRDMHQRLIRRGFKIDRESVRFALNIADLQGVTKRSKHRLVTRKYVTKGPNYSWHIDRNDKLKPLGVFNSWSHRRLQSAYTVADSCTIK